jgi:hypothetical protein
MSTVIQTFCINVSNRQDACCTRNESDFDNGVDKTQKPAYITQAFRLYLMAQS